jgi:hypothetical protein
VPVNHHDREKIVELIRVPGRFEADILIAKLHANGIDASGSHGDAGGWAPQLALLDGHSVMVFESDLERATALIAEE